MLHPIDRQKPQWTDEDLEKLLVFCLLDRAMPYEKVCKVFDWLNRISLTTRKGIKESGYGIKELSLALSTKEAGHRFPNQTAKFLHAFSKSTYNLRTITRDELMTEQPGLGYKLASMFLRNTRGEDYAVLDVHIKRWMEERGFNPDAPYKDLEHAFLMLAKGMGKTAYELDMEIWEERRIGNRKKNVQGK